MTRQDDGDERAVIVKKVFANFEDRFAVIRSGKGDARRIADIGLDDVAQTIQGRGVEESFRRRDPMGV